MDTTIHTTADALFAECWGHSAKPAKHSAKALPSAALGKGLSAKILSAKISLPSAKNRHSAKPLPWNRKKPEKIGIFTQKK